MATFTNQATAAYTVGLLPQTTSSNAVTSMSAESNFPLVKTQAHDILLPGTIQTYTISGINKTGVKVDAFILTDHIPVGLTLVAGTFLADGLPVVPTILGNVLSYSFGVWKDGDTHTFSFQCRRESLPS